MRPGASARVKTQPKAGGSFPPSLAAWSGHACAGLVDRIVVLRDGDDVAWFVSMPQARIVASVRKLILMEFRSQVARIGLNM